MHHTTVSPAHVQVIPPGAHAKFPLTLRTLEMRSFNEKVDYCLNGSHVLSFSVAAQVGGGLGGVVGCSLSGPGKR
jgi:hypothetical protein